MIGEDFMFGSTWLSEFSMKMYDPDETQAFTTRNIDKSEITALRAKPNHFGTTYSDVLVLNFLILKDEEVCEIQENYRLDGDEVHYIRSWLESPKKPTELVVISEEDVYNVHYYGTFTSVQPFIHKGDCYGLYLQFTCDSPYGYSDNIEKVFNLKSGSSDTIVGKYTNISAEKNEYLKPVVSIIANTKFGENTYLKAGDEEISIINQSDGNNEMKITLPAGLSKVIIDCENKVITDENGKLLSMKKVGVSESKLNEWSYYGTDSYFFYWLSLLSGENRIAITPSSNHSIKQVRISAKFKMKNGGF